ncbi:MAG: hypothetical protein ACOCZ2_01380 [Thermodesulfobacteriota bacterium]
MLQKLFAYFNREYSLKGTRLKLCRTCSIYRFSISWSVGNFRGEKIEKFAGARTKVEDMISVYSGEMSRLIL